MSHQKKMIDLLSIIQTPHLSEKSTWVNEKYNQVVFRVNKKASKYEIKQAVETLFNVKVEKVTTLLVKGKTRNFRQIKGKKQDWKKAYVSLAEGQRIDVLDKE
jgi:large subunit ribosomal protein L23